MDEQNQIAAETPPVNKILIRLVAWLGVLLLLMFFVLVAGIIYKATNKRALSLNPADVVLAVGLPPDEKFQSVVLTGDKLTINTGSLVYVIDVPTRRVLLKVQGQQD
jgi:hypothetical protein